jgi:hypothetical protein
MEMMMTSLAIGLGEFLIVICFFFFLVSSIHTQDKKEATSIEQMCLSDWSAGKSVGPFS